MSEGSIDESDVFTWKDIRIQQDEGVLKVGTDALLLGAWVSQVIPFASFICDAGTGSGILALMMARNFPNAEIVAIDTEEQALELAQYNIRHSQWTKRMQVKMECVLQMPSLRGNEYDLILSNPPFYTNQNPSLDDFKAKAKHMAVPVAHWMHGLLQRINDKGHVCIVVPSEEAWRWIAAANENGFYNRGRLDIYTFTRDLYPKRSLLQFVKDLQKPGINRLSIYEANKQYTPEYLTLSGIQPTNQKIN